MGKTYSVVYSNRFGKNLKKLLKQEKDKFKLINVVDKLANGELLDPKYNDHPLYDNKKLKNCHDLHIEPDWVLIYKYSGDEIILLVITGSHSEIFGQ